jgi:hypothetical protein
MTSASVIAQAARSTNLAARKAARHPNKSGGLFPGHATARFISGLLPIE